MTTIRSPEIENLGLHGDYDNLDPSIKSQRTSTALKNNIWFLRQPNDANNPPQTNLFNLRPHYCSYSIYMVSMAT
jgi:hypothetical protein